MIAAVLLSACGGSQTTMSDQWPGIPAEVVRQVQVPAQSPTDVLVRPDGTVWVLDGYHGRILPVAPDGTVGAPLGGADVWGHPVRFAVGPSENVWLVDPGGRLVEIDEDAHTLRSIPVAATNRPEPGGPPAGPVALVQDGGSLVVSDRNGRIVWLDPESGAVQREVNTDIDQEKFGTVTDLMRGPDGSLYAADAVAGRVHRSRPDGSWQSFGRYGLWVGTMKQPKAVLPEGDGVLVADSELGAVQLFGADGTGRGVLTQGGEPMKLQHPIALDRGFDGQILILEADTATVWTVKLDPTTVSDALLHAPARFKRRPLVAEDVDPVPNATTCRQCHDGLVNDSRFVWDDGLGHHPLYEKPEKPLPAFFEHGPEGGLVCVTCHSPHGNSTLADVASVKEDGDREVLLRHQASETFLRLTRDDSSLCIACHTDEPHEDAVSKLGIGGAHPVGAALAKKMQGRGDAEKGRQCMTCHAVHGAEGDHLMRGEADGKLCVSCHENQADPATAHPTGLSGAPSRPAPGPEANLPLDLGGRATCRTCHDLAGGRGAALVRLPDDGGNVCGSCHTEQRDALAKGHAGVRHGDGPVCTACHDPHPDKPSDELLRAFGAARTDADPAGCLGCHRTGGAGADGGVVRGGHPVDGKAHPPLSKDPVTCLTCHDPHGPTGDIPECASCHTEQGEAAKRGGHGEATCVDCHPPHRDPPAARIAGVNPATQACLGCHLDGMDGAPKLASWEHPEELVFRPDGTRWSVLTGLPLYGADGEMVPSGQNGELTCSSCHLEHGPDALEPGDSLRRPGWKEVCTSCHGADALVYYRYFHQPERRSSVKEAP